MHSLIKKRAQERKLEKEKAEKAQLLAEAWIGESQPQAVVPSHVPVSSRESSPTLTRLRSALGSTQRDGDDSDRNESTVKTLICSPEDVLATQRRNASVPAGSVV